MIKAILFDFDGVLTIDKTGSEQIIRHIASNAGISLDTFEAAYYKYNDGLLLGEVTHGDIWAQLCRDVHTDLDFSLLTDAFINTRIDHKMLRYVGELKRKYKTGLITDNKKDRIDAVSKLHRFDELFDVMTVSADVHARKDGKQIFEQTILRLDVRPDACVFIDNSPENLIVPREMGMTALMFDDENRNIVEFREELEKYL
jgi:putative hydrolase of the HAD superfamily